MKNGEKQLMAQEAENHRNRLDFLIKANCIPE